MVLLKLHNINFQTDQHINRQKKVDISPKIINDYTKVRIQITITVPMKTDDATANRNTVSDIKTLNVASNVGNIQYAKKKKENK